MKRITILTLSILLFSATQLHANVKAKQRPNVLFIAIDDLNDWTGTLKGNPQAKTPHMDRLASKGMLFANAHCAAPACGPSRSAIMSGIRPSTSGNFTVIIPSYDLVVVRRGLDKQPRRHGFGRWTSAAEVLKAFSHQ